MQSEQQFDARRNSDTDPREQHEEPPRAVNRDPREQVMNTYGYRESKADYIQPPQRQRRRRPRFIGLLIGLLFLLLVGSGWLFGGNRYSPGMNSNVLPTHTFTVTGKDTLHVKSTHGNIRIHQGQTDSVVVTATKHSPIFGNLGDNLKVDYKQNGNDLTVDIEGNSGGLFFNSAYIDLDITVPTESNLDMYDASGDITVTDISGQITAETGSGDIDVSRTQGTSILKTGSGDIDTREMDGTTNIETGSGDITLRDARLEGESVLHTGSGDIEFNGSLSSSGKYTIETGSGDIDLTLPVDSSLQLNIDSNKDVENDFHTQTIGNGTRAPVSIHTGSGDINIHKQ